MARPAGVRNQDFDQKRDALLGRLIDFLLHEEVELPSLRQMAIASDTSEPTIRHYFTDRVGVIVAALEKISEDSAPIRDQATSPSANLTEAVNEYLDFILMIRQSPRYRQTHALGLREGLNDPAIREAYIKLIVEPGIDAVASKLMKSPGGPSTFDAARSAATMVVSSSVFSVLFQDVMGGKKHFPMDLDAHFEHTRHWLLRGLVADPNGSGEG